MRGWLEGGKLVSSLSSFPSPLALSLITILPLIVSLRNRSAVGRGRQNACARQTWQGYYLRVLSWSSLYTNVSGLSQKELTKEKRSLAKIYFKQNYCHACHTRFAVFFPLPSCCVSSLFMVYDRKTTYNRLSSCSLLWWRRKEMWAGKTAWRHAALPYLNAWNMQASYHVKIPIQEYEWYENQSKRWQ